MRRATVAAMANAHSHAFQIDLRGAGERPVGDADDFWSWRTEMYRLAGSHDPASMRVVGDRVYAQMAAAGYGAVGEFHYVHHRPDGRAYEEPNAMAIALAQAARAQGLEITLLPAAYHRAGPGREPSPGQLRFCDPDVDTFLTRVDGLRTWAQPHPGVSVGVAVHSVRAVPADWIEAIAEYADRHQLVRHVHACEQRRELAECQAEHGCSPIELLARCQLPRGAHQRRPRDPRRRARHRAAGGQRLDRDQLPDHRGEPRRRLPARAALSRCRGAAGDRHRLAGADRSVRGAARARDRRPS